MEDNNIQMLSFSVAPVPDSFELNQSLTAQYPNAYGRPVDQIYDQGATGYNNHVMSDEEYLALLPPGYRFYPKDEELIIEYLWKKVMSAQLPPNKIKEVQIYAHTPEELSEMRKGEKVMYFFSSRDRKYAGGTRPDRSARDGFWKASGKGKEITYNGEKIGCKTSLVYYRGTQRQGYHTKTNWLMNEYTLPQSEPKDKGPGNKVLDKWVLCRVYHSGKADKEPKPVNAVPAVAYNWVPNSEHMSSAKQEPEFADTSVWDVIYRDTQPSPQANHDNPGSSGSTH